MRWPDAVRQHYPHLAILGVDRATVSMGGGFHHTAYEVQRVAVAAGTATWKLTFVSEDNPDTDLDTITLPVTDDASPAETPVDIRRYRDARPPATNKPLSQPSAAPTP